MGSDPRIKVARGTPAEDQDPLFLHQSRQIRKDMQNDCLRRVLDLNLAARDKPVPIPYLLRHDDPAEPIHLLLIGIISNWLTGTLIKAMEKVHYEFCVLSPLTAHLGSYRMRQFKSR